MKILITGCAGFIGYHISKKLLNNGYNVVGVDNLNNYYDINLKSYRLSKLTTHKNFTFIKIDISKTNSIFSIFETYTPDVVINLAAQAGVRYSIENPKKYFDSNVHGFFNILEACKIFKPILLLYASSSSVYGDVNEVPYNVTDNTNSPESFYAATKKCNELMSVPYSKIYGLNSIGLRFFTVYGPLGRPDMAPWLFTKAIMNDNAINIYNNGDMSRDFTFIDDIVNGLFLILKNFSYDKTSINKIYNIGFGGPVHLLEFIETLESYLNKKAIRNYMPFQEGDVHKTFADISSFKTDYSYQPTTDIKIGLEKWVKWYKIYHRK